MRTRKDREKEGKLEDRERERERELNNLYAHKLLQVATHGESSYCIISCASELGRRRSSRSEGFPG